MRGSFLFLFVISVAFLFATTFCSKALKSFGRSKKNIKDVIKKIDTISTDLKRTVGDLDNTEKGLVKEDKKSAKDKADTTKTEEAETSKKKKKQDKKKGSDDKGLLNSDLFNMDSKRISKLKKLFS